MPHEQAPPLLLPERRRTAATAAERGGGKSDRAPISRLGSRSRGREAMGSWRMRSRLGDPAGEALGGGHFGGASSLRPVQLPREPPAAWGSLRGRGERAQARAAGRGRVERKGAEQARQQTSAVLVAAAAAWRRVPPGSWRQRQ